MDAILSLYDRITDPALLVRRITMGANHVIGESVAQSNAPPEQLDMFRDYETLCRCREREEAALEREKRRQKVILDIKKKYGKNAILKGTNLEEGATAMARNCQIGGHKA